MRHSTSFSIATFLLNSAIVLLSSVASAQQTPSGADANSLSGKRWTLTEMEGRKFSAAEPYLEFDGAQKRVAGSGGCNRFGGTFEVEGSSLKVSKMISTRRACLDGEVQRVETTFLRLLQTSTRFEVKGNTLRLYAGSALALVFQAKDSSAADLAGTSWQLMKFQSSDGTIVRPDDKSKYTITFEREGRVAARIDCNRGGGAWNSSSPGQLQFGALALTRAMCPPGSLHDRIVKDLPSVRSYVIKDGHLFLSLMADGGIYEFEPIGGSETGSAEGSVTGTVSYLQRMALKPNAVVEVKLVDVSRADAPSITIAEQAIKPAGRQVPIAFELRYDPSRIAERGRYAIQARILAGNKLLFINDGTYLVITGGNPNSVNVTVKAVR